MLPELSTTDILKIAGIYFVTTASTLLWLSRSSQYDIPKSVASAISIAARNLVVNAGVVVLFCGCMEFTVDGLLKWSPLALILFALSFPRIGVYLGHLAPGGSGGEVFFAAFLAALIVTFIVPVYLLRQFVLSFHGVKLAWENFSRSNLPPEVESRKLKHTPNEYADQQTTAVVVAALRPMGKVKIGEKKYNARHIFGTLIDSGTKVMVTGMQNGLLLVREVIVEGDTGAGISSGTE